MVSYRIFYLSLLLALFWSKAFSTEYFVNSISGSDQNLGTSSNAPWKSLTPVQNMTFQPGDIINFARGSSWTKAAWEYVLLIDDNGTADKPIIFRSYGTGAKPSFSNGGSKWNKGIKVSGSYVVIEDLLVTNTGHAAFEFSAGANNNIVQNCEVNACGIGFMVYGQNNIFTKNYIHNLIMVVDNELPDNQSGGGDFGCVSFWLYAPNNEISYNTSIDNIGHSYDYKFDGGFLEFYDNCNGTYAHHNWVENGVGIVEGTSGTGKNIKISYNVFIENLGLFALHTNSFTIENLRFENNTCITRKGTIWNNMFNFWADDQFLGAILVRNNIFVLGGKSSERVSQNTNFVHDHNLYYLIDGAQLGALIEGEGEKLGNPAFWDEPNKNYRIKENSPAKDAGIDLGYTLDFINRPVPYGNSPDMGAYEFDFRSGNEPIVNPSFKKRFLIYPNPAFGQVNVELPFSGFTKIEIANLSGEVVLVMDRCLEKAEIGLNKLTPGFYIAKALSGSKCYSKTLIVQ